MMWRWSVLVCLAIMAGLMPVQAARVELLVDAASGKVLHEQNAGAAWYPASLTKLMTAYVALDAVRLGRMRLDSLLTISERAMAQQPSKMGFRPGVQITLDNALKMLMVKSANDVAVAIAEGVGGDVDRFSEMMNAHSSRLGMIQSRWVNPNGLPDEGQITSARDMAILARALLSEFPQHDGLWRLPGIRLGKIVMRNHNALIDRYIGADGMKTGFICASGFNIVASASRDSRRLIAVVMGANTARERNEKTAQLFERGFTSASPEWLRASQGQVEAVRVASSVPENLKSDVCGPNRKRPAEEDYTEVQGQVHADLTSAYAGLAGLPALTALGGGRQSLLGAPFRPLVAVPVYVGPASRVAESETQDLSSFFVPEKGKAAAARKPGVLLKSAAPDLASSPRYSLRPSVGGTPAPRAKPPVKP